MKNKMNKKAWIRVVEAVIGIMIIIGGILYLAPKQSDKADISNEVYKKQREILEVIANEEKMRTEIIWNKTDLADEFISKNIPSNWGFATNICNIDIVCNENTPNDRDIYVSETIISSNLTDYPGERTRKLMFFVWRK